VVGQGLEDSSEKEMAEFCLVFGVEKASLVLLYPMEDHGVGVE
jgi:hypothetical protein